MLDDLGKLSFSIIIYIVIIAIFIILSLAMKVDNKAIVETRELLSKGIKKPSVKKGSNEDELQSLIDEVKHSISQLQYLRAQYEFALDEEVIEYIIYREKAEEEKISYLIRKIKDMEVKDVI